MPKEKKLKKPVDTQTEDVQTTQVFSTPIPEMVIVKPESDMIEIKKSEWDKVQEQLKMLVEVADKGRVFNYQSSQKTKNPIKVKLSVFRDSIIVGWRTVKDELVKHPTTGKTVGERQEYELMLLGKDSEGSYTVASKATLEGYNAFSDARYDTRIEAEVVGKREDFEGSVDFDIMLPDGKMIKLNSRFVN